MNAPQSSLRAQVSEQEWQLRVELAAVYRLVALYGWDDLVFTHISARIPGPEHHFLINPYGLMFEEITASSLVKIDMDCKPLHPTPYKVNPAGFVIHSAFMRCVKMRVVCCTPTPARALACRPRRADFCRSPSRPAPSCLRSLITITKALRSVMTRKSACRTTWARPGS